jgi:hypothetical protein
MIAGEPLEVPSAPARYTTTTWDRSSWGRGLSFPLSTALVLGWWINAYLAPAYGETAFYAVDGGMFVALFVLALLLGVASDLGPARRATRIDPVEVLREA